MRWAFLGIAIVLEVVGTMLMKRSYGFEHLAYGAASLVAYVACLFFLGLALKGIPVAVAYGVWSGAGIAMVSVLGWLVFKEPISNWRLVFLALVLVGCVGLQLTELYPSKS